MKRNGKATGLRPDFCFSRAIDIHPDWLQSLGIKGLLLDIDNTITRWERQVVPPEELSWLNEIQSAGIACRLLSNGLARKKALVAKQTGIPHVSGYYIKPLRRSFRQGLKDLGLPGAQVLMVGDSVVTDIIAANLAGLWTALVEPLSPVDFMGSKLYRLIEHLLRLRQAIIPAQDFRGKKSAASSGTSAPA